MRHNRKSVKKKITWLNHTKRLCNCPPNYLSCIDAKEWVRRMIGIWEFDYEKRDVRNRKIHPATFPISLVKKVITIYTHDGEVVLDPFNGVGTTLVAAKDVKRHAIGIDLHPNYCETARERLQFSSLTKFLEKTDHNLHYETINDDALYMLEYIPRNSIDLVITSPPYANLLNRKRTNKSKHSRKRKDARLGVIEQYSDNKNDL